MNGQQPMTLQTFMPALRFVSHAMAKNDVRYVLNGLLIEAGDAALTLTATDGHRLATITVHGAHELPPGEYIVARDAVIDWLKRSAYKTKQKDDPVPCNLCRHAGTANAIAFEASGQLTALTLIDGKYPDWRHVLPSGGPAVGSELTIGVDASYLADAAKAALHIANAKYKGMRLVLRDEKTAMVLTVAPDPKFDGALSEGRVVIMPMKL